METLLALTAAELDALARVAVFTHGYDEWSWDGPKPETAYLMVCLGEARPGEFAAARPARLEDLGCTRLSSSLTLAELHTLAQLAVQAWHHGDQTLLSAHQWLRGQDGPCRELLSRADLLLSDDIGVAALLHQAG